MKILGGALKGKNIEAVRDRNIRPTKSMVRETIFNILKHGKFLFDDAFIEDDNPSTVEDRHVIDIFCGTGALGFEALSRGAKHVTFVDQNSATIAQAKENANHLGVRPETRFIKSDSTQLPPASHACQLAFVDPPYEKLLGKKAIKSLRDQGWLSRGAVVLLESSKQYDAPEIEGFRLMDDRIHDKTRISFYQYEGE